MPPTSTEPSATPLAPPAPFTIAAGGVTIGGPALALVAGPCAVEGRAMLLETARGVRAAGATLLRGGAFKPRTSPHAFRGLGDEALDPLDPLDPLVPLDPLDPLAEAHRVTGLPIVTEVMDQRQVKRVAEVAHVLQIGARNMQNYALLAEVGRARVPAESRLPVLVDPSHAGGHARLVLPLALAAVAAGADGLLVEVHPQPASALSDGDPSLTPAAFAEPVRRLAPVAAAVGRTVPVDDARHHRPMIASEAA